MQQKHYHVYILTNKRNTVLYTGVTANLSTRVWQHAEKQDKKSFTAKYNLNKLVYCEEYGDINEAIAREKQVKAGSRKKKIDLIT
ncbi:MAG: GIY-YIG nuclease family protein [Syntrophomonadaceae bacterium]|nr:GIY-YIG nuclease family protein [Syntrophomonadaceae bacterium]